MRRDFIKQCRHYYETVNMAALPDAVKYPAAAAGPEGLPPGHEPLWGGAWLGEG